MKYIFISKLFQNVAFLIFFLFSNLIFFKKLFHSHLYYNFFSSFLIFLFFIFIIFSKETLNMDIIKKNKNLVFFFLSFFCYLLALLLINNNSQNYLYQFYGLIFKLISFSTILYTLGLNFKNKFYFTYTNLLFLITLPSIIFYFLAYFNFVGYENGFILYKSSYFLRLGNACGEPSVYAFLLFIGNLITIKNKEFFKFSIFLLAGILTFSNLYILLILIILGYEFKKYILLFLPIIILFFYSGLKIFRFDFQTLLIRFGLSNDIVFNSPFIIGKGLYSTIISNIDDISGAGYSKLISDLGLLPFFLVLTILIYSFRKIEDKLSKLIFLACLINIMFQDTYTSILQYTFLIYAIQKN